MKISILLKQAIGKIDSMSIQELKYKFIQHGYKENKNMCVISMIGSGWKDQFPVTYPSYPNVSPTEFEKLKREVQELKKLIEAAKRFDEVTGQKDCENAEKVAFIKEVAKFVGVDIEIV